MASRSDGHDFSGQDGTNKSGKGQIAKNKNRNNQKKKKNNTPSKADGDGDGTPPQGEGPGPDPASGVDSSLPATEGDTMPHQGVAQGPELATGVDSTSTESKGVTTPDEKSGGETEPSCVDSSSSPPEGAAQQEADRGPQQAVDDVSTPSKADGDGDGTPPQGEGPGPDPASGVDSSLPATEGDTMPHQGVAQGPELATGVDSTCTESKGVTTPDEKSGGETEPSCVDSSSSPPEGAAQQEADRGPQQAVDDVSSQGTDPNSNTADDQVKRLEDEIKTLSENIEQMKKEKKTMSDKILEKEADIKSLKYVIDEKDKELQKVKRMEKEIDTLKSDAIKKDEEMKRLKKKARDEHLFNDVTSKNYQAAADKNSKLESKIEQIEKEAKRLKGVADKLEKENQQMKTMVSALKPYEDGYNQAMLEVSRLTAENRNLCGYKNMYPHLMQEKQTLLNTNHALEAEKETLLLRLSKIAGANLTYNNPNIADLSDEKRPTKLAEEFSELYDNEWTDAFEEVEGIDDESKTRVLYNLLEQAYTYCEKLSSGHKEAIQGSFTTLNYTRTLSQPREEPQEETVVQQADQMTDESNAPVEESNTLLDTDHTPMTKDEDEKRANTEDQGSKDTEEYVMVNAENVLTSDGSSVDVGVEVTENDVSTKVSHGENNSIIKPEVTESEIPTNASNGESKKDTGPDSSDNENPASEVQTESKVGPESGENKNAEPEVEAKTTDHVVNANAVQGAAGNVNIKPVADKNADLSVDSESGTGENVDAESGTGDNVVVESGTGENVDAESGTGDNVIVESGAGLKEPENDVSTLKSDKETENVDQETDNVTPTETPNNESNQNIRSEFKEDGASTVASKDESCRDKWNVESKTDQPRSTTMEIAKVEFKFDELSKEQKKMIMDIKKLCEIKQSPDVTKVGTGIIAEQMKISTEAQEIMTYISKCIDICWSMHRHVPPVYIDFSSYGADEPFDTKMYRAYTKSGKRIHFVVWPAIHLHKGGPLLAKGVAQGRN